MKPTRIIFFVWLAWALIMITFQAWMGARLAPHFPDRALSWTTDFTGPDYQVGQKYLLEPFMNAQVAWDSEYYLAIAVGGYDDSATDLVGPADNQLTLSYSFLPLYPLLIRLFAFPLSILGMNAIATATLAGVIVSALGALAAMYALYDLTRDSLGEDGALRTAFYFIIFPTAFFLVQVYTEGVFAGLAFGCLAMLRRKNWLLAAILACCTVLTRAVGIAILIPMLVNWWRTRDGMDFELGWRQLIPQRITRRSVWRAFLLFAPLITFLIWKFSFYGIAFTLVEKRIYGSAFMDLDTAFSVWVEAWRSIFMGIAPRTANYILIFIIFGLGILASFKTMKEYPEVAWFSLVVILISVGSGPPSGIHRYILTTPAIFIYLARLGRNPVFDRAWTIASILWMGALAALFAWNMWVA
jgi:hypothetical protein